MKGKSMRWPRRTSCQRYMEASTPRKRISAPMAAKVQKTVASMEFSWSRISRQAGARVPVPSSKGMMSSQRTISTVR